MTNTDGLLLLEEARAQLTTYVVLPSPEAADAVVLWCAATHALPVLPFAPRLSVRSAVKRSGKSRCLEVVTALVHDPLKSVNATTAAIFRSLGGEHPKTLVFDEVDTIFGSKKVAENNEDLRGLLNAGFERGNPSIRCVGPNQIPTEFPSFGMAALGGIGSLPDTIEDRSVIIRMKRRKPTESAKPFRILRDRDPILQVGRGIAEWLSRPDVLARLEKSEPQSDLQDRAADVWESLLMVADVAGGGWPERARRAARKLVDESASDEEQDTLGVRLLHDMRTVFGLVKAEFSPTKNVLELLRTSVDESPWGELTSHKLGRMLGEFGIKSERDTTGSIRGYKRSAFEDTWERYPVTKRDDAAKSDTHPDTTEAGKASEASESGSTTSDLFKQSDTSSDALNVPTKASDKASEQNSRSNRVLTVVDASDAYPADNKPCDRCGEAPTRTDRNGARWCSTHGAHLWRTPA